VLREKNPKETVDKNNPTEGQKNKTGVENTENGTMRSEIDLSFCYNYTLMMMIIRMMMIHQDDDDSSG
jgi:hypothetical protein